MTRPAQAVAAAHAVTADRYATAAALAALEATRSASVAIGHRRIQNAASEFVDHAQRARRTGAAYEQTLSPAGASPQMAGIAAAAKYAAAAANATRYAADSARQAGAQRAAWRAERAAVAADWWADMARHRAEQSTYAPFTVLRTARYARRAAAAARYAARASGPLDRFSTGAVGLAAALLPAGTRDRYDEEWRSDLCHLPRRQRARNVVGILSAAVRLAVVLRQPALRGRR
jgi:hypothetical protein